MTRSQTLAFLHPLLCGPLSDKLKCIDMYANSKISSQLSHFKSSECCGPRPTFIHKTSRTGSRPVGLSTRYGPGRRASSEKSYTKLSAGPHIAYSRPTRSQIRDVSAHSKCIGSYARWRRRRNEKESNSAALAGRQINVRCCETRKGPMDGTQTRIRYRCRLLVAG